MVTPPALQQIVDLFAEAPRDLRLEALLEYSRSLPPLPERLNGHREQMERVVECQTPFFLASEIGDGHRVDLWFDAPPGGPDHPGLRRHPFLRSQRRHPRGGARDPGRLL